MKLSHEAVPSSYHGTPADAVSIHLDVKSRNSIGTRLSFPSRYSSF